MNLFFPILYKVKTKSDQIKQLNMNFFLRNYI